MDLPMKGTRLSSTQLVQPQPSRCTPRPAVHPARILAPFCCLSSPEVKYTARSRVALWRASCLRSQASATSNFADYSAFLRDELNEHQVIPKESWEKLLGKVTHPEEAGETLGLLLEDAALREQQEWDWSTLGYGSILLDLMQVAARVHAPRVVKEVLHLMPGTFHATVNKDTVPKIMRRCDAEGCQVVLLERLLEVEVELRGSNSPAAFKALFKAYRQRGLHGEARALCERVRREEAEGRLQPGGALLPYMERLLEGRERERTDED